MISLRPYQVDAIEKLRSSYAKGKRAPLFVLPTGGGKTIIFSYMASRATERGKQVGIIVHRRELLEQARRTLPPGVAVHSINSLVKHLDKHEFDFLVFDEAHHATASMWRKVIAAYPRAQLLGMTASPCRSDGAGLGEIFDDMIIGPSMRALIDGGHLVEPEVYAPPNQLDLTGMRRSMGDYEKRELENRVDRPTITGSAVQHYIRLCGGQPAIAFCVGLRHAEHVARDFKDSGIRAESIDGTLDTATRAARLEKFRSGGIDVLVSVDLIGEGLDVPSVGAAILLRPTQSTSLFMQQCGRALRPAPGKTRAIILDHVGNAFRHGLPDQEREWSLDPAKKIRARCSDDPDALDIKQCDACFAVFRPSRVCPRCGIEQIIRARVVRETPGELKRIARLELEKTKAAATRKRINEEMSCSNVDELEALGRRRGYPEARAWAWRKWKFIEMGRRRRRVS